MESSDPDNARLIRIDSVGEPRTADIAAAELVIGRGDGAGLIPSGDNVNMVSQQHARLFYRGGVLHVDDLESTNGTFVDGERITQSPLPHGSVLSLGRTGPQFRVIHQAPAEPLPAAFVKEDGPTRLERPEATEPAPVMRAAKSPAPSDETLLVRAVAQAREARLAGAEGHTGFFMREALNVALARTRSKAKRRLLIVASVLGAVIAIGAWRINSLQRRQTNIDHEITRIEGQLQTGGQSEREVEELIDRLAAYQRQAEALQRDVLFQFSPEGRERLFLDDEIERVLEAFGAREYDIPADFVSQVAATIEVYQTRDRATLERVLGPAAADMARMQDVLAEHKLPRELAYVTVVESAFRRGAGSSRGARGYWQLRPVTARAYGLTVGDGVDERTDPAKSTEAAARYIRELILDFGAGSSVMLALAAYNVGPGRVRGAVRKVEDPIAQRNFWHLYRVGALPAETRQFVPKVFAAIIIARSPERFGFGGGDTRAGD